MTLARVIGCVWATVKDESLGGRTMLLVQPVGADGRDRGRPTAALDTVGAGPGDRVVVVTSAEAALPFLAEHPLTATDATVVGVVDSIARGERARRA